jgi:hypothetical protein
MGKTIKETAESLRYLTIDMTLQAERPGGRVAYSEEIRSKLTRLHRLAREISLEISRINPNAEKSRIQEA